MELAVRSGRGFTSLPEHEPTLRQRLELSAASFAGEGASEEAWYTLMLEETDTGEVYGVAGVKARVGMKRPFYSFRVVTYDPVLADPEHALRPQGARAGERVHRLERSGVAVPET
jgi:arginine/ornithine N-succinyltransferase beta subunit